MPCFGADDVAAAKARIEMQQQLGVDVRWVDPAEVDAMNPAMARA